VARTGIVSVLHDDGLVLSGEHLIKQITNPESKSSFQTKGI